jgi:hypothetical protein
MRKVNLSGRGRGRGTESVVRTDSDSSEPRRSVRNSWSIVAPACARWPSVTAVRDPTTHASCCLWQKCSKSVTAPLAAEKPSLALTCRFGVVCEPPFGSKTKTTASQNVIRRKNHIARPCFPRRSNPHPWTQEASIVKARSQISEVFGRRSNHRLGINQRNPYVGIGSRLALDESVTGL